MNVHFCQYKTPITDRKVTTSLMVKGGELMQRMTRWLVAIGLLAYSLLTVAQEALTQSNDYDADWNTRLKAFYFHDQTLLTDEQVVSISAPDRAEDPSHVPITIRTGLTPNDKRFIRQLYVIIDHNPNPLAAKFTLTPKNGIANLDLFIRVDNYSPVRVVAATSDNQWYMASHYVKASGGCSAPLGSDKEQALKDMGSMRFKLTKPEQSDLTQVNLFIKHPNFTGLQRDQLTQLILPPHYIREVEVKLDDELILSAETDISISENPVLGFYVQPAKATVLTATVTDTKGNTFTQQQQLSESTSAKP